MTYTESATTTVTETQKIIKRFHRGDIREDGKIFWAYHRRDGELWFTPEQFRHRKEAKALYEKGRITPLEARERNAQRTKLWQKENVQRATRRANARRKERRQNDPMFAMASRFRANIHQALKKRGERKTNQCSITLGCTWPEFREHIESRFLFGMSWDNREEWHLDHVVPLALGKTEQDIIELNHYTNLRPLWRDDNLRKSDTIPPRDQFPPRLLRFLPEE